MPDSNDFTLGAHSARLDNVERTLSEMNEKLERILAVTERARGSWKTLAVIGGSLTAVIEGSHQLVAWLSHK